jgi:hypothetical protein
MKTAVGVEKVTLISRLGAVQGSISSMHYVILILGGLAGDPDRHGGVVVCSRHQEWVVFSVCSVLGLGNVGKQLDKSYR